MADKQSPDQHDRGMRLAEMTTSERTRQTPPERNQECMMRFAKLVRTRRRYRDLGSHIHQRARGGDQRGGRRQFHGTGQGDCRRVQGEDRSRRRAELWRQRSVLHPDHARRAVSGLSLGRRRPPEEAGRRRLGGAGQPLHLCDRQARVVEQDAWPRDGRRDARRPQPLQNCRSAIRSRHPMARRPSRR